MREREELIYGLGKCMVLAQMAHKQTANERTNQLTKKRGDTQANGQREQREEKVFVCASEPFAQNESNGAERIALKRAALIPIPIPIPIPFPPSHSANHK